MQRRLFRWTIILSVAVFVAFVAVIIALDIAFSRLSSESVRQARVEATHRADIIATADAQYEQCVKSIPFLVHTTRFVASVRQVERVLVVNSKANHAATPPGSDLYRVQGDNIKRLERALRDASGLNLHVPTPAECRRIRAAILRRP